MDRMRSRNSKQSEGLEGWEGTTAIAFVLSRLEYKSVLRSRYAAIYDRKLSDRIDHGYLKKLRTRDINRGYRCCFFVLGDG
jgi:hypothetical protein